MDEGGSRAEALAYRDGRIVAVGDREAVLREAGEAAEVLDAGSATVLPGFIDAHHHVSLSALYAGPARLAPPSVTSIGSLQATLADAGQKLAPGRWLVATEWDEGRLAERRAPTRAELDDAVPDRPLFALHQTCHRGLANSRALELAGIDRSTPDPCGGLISRGAGGLPDGLLIERGMSAVETLARADLVAHDAEGGLARLAAHYRALVEVGITRVADPGVPPDLLPLYRESAERGDVRVPTIVCPVSISGWLEAPWDVLDGPRTGERAGPLTVGPAKLIFDGAPGCAMCLSWGQAVAALVRTVGLALRTGSLDPIRTSFSIAPRPGARVRSGIRIYRPEEARQVVGALVERGFGVATHALGNDAVQTALGAYESAGSALGGAWVPRLEHGAFLDRNLVSRIAGNGVAVTAQPGMLAMPMYASAVSIPNLPFFPLRWLLEEGVLVAGSSDHPVDTFDPLVGIRAACARRNARCKVVDEDQCISEDEALAMYTRGAAEACGSLAECGTLEVGKRADLIVLDGEPAGDACVRATVIGGELAHGRISAATL